MRRNKGCHSSVDQKNGLPLCTRFAEAYFAEKDASPDKDASPPVEVVIEESDVD